MWHQNVRIYDDFCLVFHGAHTFFLPLPKIHIGRPADINTVHSGCVNQAVMGRENKIMSEY